MEVEKNIEFRLFRRLRQIWSFLHCFPAAGAIFLLSYSSALVLEAARNSGEFLRRAASVLVSPASIFLLGNAIVLVLFAKSGKISTSSSSISETESVILSGDIRCELSYPPPPPHLGTADVEIRDCSRSLPERFERIREEGKLRLAETEVGRNSGMLPETAHDRGMVLAQDRVEDEDDAEQFRRTIEEFIAKQQQFQREESLTVVSCSVGLADHVAV